MPRRNRRVCAVREFQDARNLACFLVVRRASPVIPITRRGEAARGERRKAVIVRRSLWPGWRWSKVPPTTFVVLVMIRERVIIKV